MKVCICGVGAIGSNLIEQLCAMHPEYDYYIIDFDKVEDRNINTQFYFKNNVGREKTVALRLSCFVKYPECKITAINRKLYSTEELVSLLKESYHFSDEDLVLDCFDNIPARTIVTNSNFKNILHLGFNPELHGEICWNESYKIPKMFKEDIDICTNSYAKPFIMFFVSLSAMVVQDFFEKKEKNNYIVFNKTNITKVQ